ncbi:MAG: CDP-diacylglycerol--glycerol-3-phosphate 3-phosphatidyltransferase [Solirubrobacterales bacterium]
MNIPNVITGIRILMVPLIIYLMIEPIPYARLWAALIFGIAVVSDFVDGYIARRFGWVTDFGAYLDPLADKLLIGTLLIALAALDHVPIWMVVVILAREIAVTVYRSVQARRGISVPASPHGKWKTVFQYIAVFIVLLVPVYPTPFFQVTAMVSLYLAVIVTVLSGAAYLVQFTSSTNA